MIRENLRLMAAIICAATPAHSAPLPVGVPVQFQGEWRANFDECPPAVTDRPVWISSTRVRMDHAVGEVRPIRPGDRRNVTVEGELSDEGETRVQTLALRLSPSGDELTISGRDGTVTLKRCPTVATAAPTPAIEGVKVERFEQMVGLLEYATCVRWEAGTINEDRAANSAAYGRARVECRNKLRANTPEMNYPGAPSPKEFLRIRLDFADRFDAYLMPLLARTAPSPVRLRDRMRLMTRSPGGKVIRADAHGGGTVFEMADKGLFYAVIDEGATPSGSAK